MHPQTASENLQEELRGSAEEAKVAVQVNRTTALVLCLIHVTLRNNSAEPSRDFRKDLGDFEARNVAFSTLQSVVKFHEYASFHHYQISSFIGPL